jgi:hypothetical protein
MKRCNVPQVHSTGLSGTQFSTLKIAEINDPEGSENHNNTEVRGNFLPLPYSP